MTEAAGLSDDRFDEGRLIQGLEAACYSRLNLQAVLDYLLCCLGCFVGAEGSLQDDTSMVVLKVEPK